MLVIYLTMDEGSARKEQVMNALWGCVISQAIWLVVWFGLVVAST